MRREIATDEGRWIDIVQPHEDDFAFLRDHLRIHAPDVADARAASHLPKLQVRPSYLYLVVHVLVPASGPAAFTVRELDVFVSREAVVTMHAAELPLLDTLFREMESRQDLAARALGQGSAYLLYAALERVYVQFPPFLVSVMERLKKDEALVFAGAERSMVAELASLRRSLVAIRSVLRPQRDMYDPALLLGDWETPAWRAIFRSLSHKLDRMWEDAETLWERAEALAGTNEQLLNYKLNEFVKVLTVISAVFIPLGLVAQVVVVLHEDVPATRQATFWGLILLMLLIDCVILWRARRRRIL